MNNKLKKIINWEWTEKYRRKEKSKYFTEEFFEKHSLKYRNLIEQYEVLGLNIRTKYHLKESENLDFSIISIDLGNKEIERVYNNLLDFQDWLEESSEEVINEMKQEIREIDKNLENKWDENLENTQEEILILHSIVIEKYGEDADLDEISDIIIKKLVLLCEIHTIYSLVNKIKILKYIPIHSNDSIYSADIGYNYLLLEKETGKIYRLDGVHSNHRPTIEEIAENFDEFMERLYIGEPFEFEDNNDYQEIVRQIQEATGKKN